MKPQLFAAIGLALLPVIGVSAPASAAPAVSCDQGDDSAFTFQSFDADYYLDVDENGRSVLTTVETFVAVFPDIDQNQGMRRAIPLEYKDAPTDISVQSVTDGEGNPRQFDVENDDDNEFLLVTSRDSQCVHGPQTYVFTYTQHNVTRFFADTDDDEFYWDTVGTGWAQPFGSVTARVHIPDSLTSSLTGDTSCYRGPEGSTAGCDLTSADESGGTVFTAHETQLGPYENVTVVVGFEPHTFVPRDESYLGSPLGFVQLIAVIGSGLALLWAAVLRRTKLADGRGRPTIIAEYSPPKRMEPFTASVLLKRTSRAAAAAFVDLAVSRKIRIVETPNTGFLARGSTYQLDLVDPSGLTGPELNLAQGLFGPTLTPGTGYLMSGKDTTLSAHVRTIIQKTTADTVTDGLRKRGTGAHGVLPTLLVVAAAAATFIAGVSMVDGAVGGFLPGVLIPVPIIIALVVMKLVFRTPLTDEGAELRDHLAGLELYIRLAEADRMQMLQSPQGAEKQAVSTSDPREIVKIYEKLLPYAVLFNLEKQWAVELGKYYADAAPDYYSGSGAFNAALFASSISSMSTTAATSYSGSSSSSSSGGSGGGGSSGGGGGGGGGGGV